MENKEYCKDHDKMCDSKEAHEKRLTNMENEAQNLKNDVAEIKQSLKPLQSLSTDLLVFKTEIKTALWAWGLLIGAGCTATSLLIASGGVVMAYLRFTASTGV
ncbi:MAG: hemolysin XhlA family protein [Bacteroidales bacterium]|jgi:hypothetical protein|nr:hemolysin XhlA family protein [Bacteroidales bacterium]